MMSMSNAPHFFLSETIAFPVVASY
jgi:hypothetical protein